MIRIDRLDHLVLTVRDIEATCRFYSRVLGMTPKLFEGSRWALHFQAQKINLHQAGREFEPKATTPTPGSADLCFIVSAPLVDVIAHLGQCGVRVLEGPVQREGATGTMQSVYVRDPDGNLLELSTYVDAAESRA
jgi:catechol 2,3-dioxygenase-like lactoylglutathione lyase family enzyme